MSRIIEYPQKHAQNARKGHFYNGVYSLEGKTVGNHRYYLIFFYFFINVIIMITSSFRTISSVNVTRERAQRKP